MKAHIRKIVTASLFAALTCVATFVIRIPSPLGGYINLGDSLVLLSGWLLSPLYAFAAAATGSAIADLSAGYVVYAPVTFLIKGIMALIAALIVKRSAKKSLPAMLISGSLAEIVMIGGYYVFEGFYYHDFVAVLANVPANAIQALFGITSSIIVNIMLKKAKVHLE